MKYKPLLRFSIGLFAAIFLSFGLKACTPPTPPPPSTTLLVAAAASLQNALEELDPIFESANTSVKVDYNFAASTPLQKQIEQGAPVDIFISAATKPMAALQSKDLIVADSRRNLLSNTLVLIVPSDSPLQITDFAELTNPNIQKIAVGEPRSVPAGQYAEELFRNLKILEPLRSKFVYGNSVRNVLSQVESGNADAGIVYGTDAKISAKVKQVLVAPDRLHSPIVYPLAVIKTSRNAAIANTYARFLASEQAQAIFKEYGFGTNP
jgi:molybdate transport system substrate-binding protein